MRPSSVVGFRMAALVLALILGLRADRATASPAVAAICDRAAASASQATGVPLSVLRAISLAETGRRRGGTTQPWPWTVNMEGEGRWFDDAESALAYVRDRHASGARSFDVGCFQINYRWHGSAFRSLEEMFEPRANALYAARFLLSLYQETRDWNAAAGAYHSRTPEFADRYSRRFADLRAGMAEEDTIPVIPDIVMAAARTEETRPRINLYPLLQGGSGGRLGSLVPAGGTGGLRPLIGPETVQSGQEAGQ